MPEDRVTAGPSQDRRPWRRRPGMVPLAVAAVLAGTSVVGTLAVSYPTGLGVMLVLVTLYAATLALLAVGIGRLRAGDDADPPDDDTDVPVPGAWAGEAGRPSWRCRVGGHREVFVARTADRPAHWTCPRCGARSLSQLDHGHAWMCVVTDHRYVHVPRRSDVAEHWRCRRCGRRRRTPPLSAGETLNATRVDQMWIKRGDEM